MMHLLKNVRVALPVCAATVALIACNTHGADNPFADIVRKTEPQAPELEQKQFHLPPGFEIELVAAEPDIGKPINMAFDEQGRLWITQSREYPFPAPADKPARDAIKILSDFDAHGRAGKITTFADGLNIPIGIYPYKNGAIAYSIPYIYSFQDTNGDGRADKKELFLGRFGYEKDTHGMTSSFRRGYDGWLYANHGYNNDSVITAKDGSSIKMNSGNTYRVKIDGSHVEQFTWGRVNPFGMFFDPLGNIYSSDCETFPIYQLMRGGYYPSFGKPDDGLGFAPAMMSHKHGSTAIAGIVYYAATNFPGDFQDNIFVGNVMTCRIDRDSLVPHGSTSIAKEQPDFLSCDDPWFRPVDLQLGPDGAIYVADFYNRIIGHYEVPLDHPGRDRERGRIWRITYRGPKANTAPTPAIHLAGDSTAGLIEQLANSNITIRMLAMNELTDHIGKDAIKPVTAMMRNKKSTTFQKIHGLWVLYRLNALDPKILAAAATDKDRALRVHAMHVFSETPVWTPPQRNLVIEGLHDADALIARNAADALGQHPQFENIRLLLDAREHAAKDDTHLIYVLRMALRNQLRLGENYARLPLPGWSKADEEAVADVSLGVPSAESARFLLHHLQNYSESREVSANQLRHAARYLPDSEAGALADFTRAKFSDDLDFQVALFKSVQEGIAQRGGTGNDRVREWAADICKHLTVSLDEKSQPWSNTPVEGKADTTNPWIIQQRASADGNDAAPFLSSLPAGEKLTGILRSSPFTIPAKLTFFIAGHDGPPGKPALKQNVVRLRAAETKGILAETYAPRIDLAQKITWDLSASAGQQGYLEFVDADSGNAYAWLAVGRFDPPVVDLPSADPRSINQRKLGIAEMARTFRLEDQQARLERWLADKTTDGDVRAAAAHALLTLDAAQNLPLVAKICADAAEPAVLREKTGLSLAEVNSPAARAALIDALHGAPERLQIKLALALAANADGAEALLQTIEAGKLSPRVLLQRGVKERLAAMKPVNFNQRVDKLTTGMTPLNDQVQKIIDKRRVDFNPAQANAASGAKVFTQFCSVCHSIDNQGGAVGPHLDGVGNRGLERLLEDVLDPSRNVDPSFRYSLVTLNNGILITGLQRREEGEVIVFVDSTGKEISVPKKDIESRVESQSSLMPDNFSEAIPLADFNNLMAFLLSKGSPAAAQR
jgi:putative heme-binding domain-containing protein